jgi:hypothetical protein
LPDSGLSRFRVARFRVARFFSWYNTPEREKIYQNYTKLPKIYQVTKNIPSYQKYTKLPKLYQVTKKIPKITKNIPNGHEMYQMAV